MREALLRTYNATPEPKWVVALGDCAVNCGVFAGSPAVVGPLADILPVDLHVPGCPPPPLDIVKALLALMEVQARRRYDRTLGRFSPSASAARLLNSASLRSSAGKKHSMRTSCRVMSCGVPSVAMVVNTDSALPPTR